MARIYETLRISLATAAILFAGTSLAEAASITLTLLPGMAISGPAGSTIGWGYKITNSTTNWVETLNLTSDVFTNGTPASIFDFPVIAPNGSVTLLFSRVVTGPCPMPDCGLFEFTWGSGLPGGTANAGTFTITSEFFGTNPLTDPNAIDFGPTPDMTASYSVTVSGVPEPTTLVLLFIGMLALILIRGPRGTKESRRAALPCVKQNDYYSGAASHVLR
jgi:hypothetical protein